MKQRQKGFTLLEITVAIGIVGAVVATAWMATTTLLLNAERPTNQQPLLQHVQNAGWWMSRDIKMTSNVTLGGANGFPVTFNIPIDADPEHDYSIEYAFTDDVLKRHVYDASSNLTEETWISRNIDTGYTTFGNVTETLYFLNIRASLSDETVTLNYDMRPRLID